MGRPMGSKNKTAVLERPIEKPVQTVIEVAKPAILNPADYSLVLTIKRHREGPFANLWELAKIEKDGTKKIITDANLKQFVVNMARNEMVDCLD